MEDEQRNLKVKSAKSQNKVRNKSKVKSGLEKKKMFRLVAKFDDPLLLF